jgi:hypothetical protein
MTRKERKPVSRNEEAMTVCGQIRQKGTGTAEFRNGHWWVKVSLPDKTRPRYRLCLEV